MAETSYLFNSENPYPELISYTKGLLNGETDIIANLSNASALLNLALHNINWVGFYILKGSELVLGPFQGSPACIRIPVGKGVCGTAVKENRCLVVEDVHLFKGHIACDSRSRSEIVITIHYNNGKIFGVLDIDSPVIGRFSENDRINLEQVIAIIEEHI